VLGAGSTGFSKEPSSDVMENKDKSKQNEHDSGMSLYAEKKRAQPTGNFKFLKQSSLTTAI
jgi:hypothetical protein